MNSNSYYRTIAIGCSIIILFLQIVFTYAYGQTSDTKIPEHPNVILILADDMGAGDISAFNKGLTNTPTLDSLVNQSIYFNQAYAGSPVCAPSRAALLTGRYPHRTGSVTLNQRRYPDLTRIDKGETTIANIFSDNGYVTGLVGKWHSGHGEEYHPLNRGFHEFTGFKGWEVSDSYFNYELDIQGTYQTFTNDYLTDHLTRRAIDFVRRHRDESFFLHLAHYAPHRPLSAPKEKIDKYLEKGFNEDTATIYAMIEIMDTGIGTLLDELEKLDIRKKTIVIFASDNGPDPLTGDRYNQNLRGAKYTIYEGGIHVPFLVNWDSVLLPTKRDEVIHFTDVLPTLTELCNLETPSLKLDGSSLAGLLFNEETTSALPERRFWQWNRGVPYYTHNAALREGNWKLVRPFVTRGIPDTESFQRPKLYNLEQDPYEKNDLAEEYPQRYDRMRVLLRQWFRKMEFDRLSTSE